MYLIRPIRESDFSSYSELAFAANLGMLSLPKNSEKLKKNIEISIQSFSSASDLNKIHFYLFVLENITTQQIGGVCGIYGSIGVDLPHYYYQKESLHLKSSPSLPIVNKIHLLRPIAISNGPSELCSLYLHSNFRKEGLGKLLSLSRFLFIKRFSERFKNEIIAEMRGFTDKENTNPFWENVGRKFLSVTYDELIQLEHKSLEFVSQVIPEYPLYIELLPKEAQETIGRVHEHTQPALNILKKEGFNFSDLFDIFDVGPILKAEKNKIRSINESVSTVMINTVSYPIETPHYILSNDRLDFRACISPIQFSNKHEALLPKETAEALEIHPGQSFSYLEIKN